MPTEKEKAAAVLLDAASLLLFNAAKLLEGSECSMKDNYARYARVISGDTLLETLELLELG